MMMQQLHGHDAAINTLCDVGKKKRLSELQGRAERSMTMQLGEEHPSPKYKKRHILAAFPEWDDGRECAL